MSSLARVLLVDKPAGPTSFDVVRRVRRGLGGRVGHTGSLDPFATGLLLILIGEATRLSQSLMGMPKEYELTVQFGALSTTGDPTGELTTGSGESVSRETVADVLDLFRGEIVQKVPLTSAVKIDGEPLYKRAHRGETADTPERQVTIYDLSLLGFDEEAQTARVLALVSSGTYLRVLAQDMGQALGVGGFAAGLQRTRIGRFTVGEALGIEELSPERYSALGSGVLSVEQALADLPYVELDPASTRLASNGNILSLQREGRFRVYGEGRLLGVYQALDGKARPLMVFSGEDSVG